MNNQPPPPDWSEDAELLFYRATRVPPADRAAFLDQECGTGSALRVEVEGLIRDHEQAGRFLECQAHETVRHAEINRLMPEEAGQFIGAYKLLEQIGEGGFGTVWVAEQQKPIRRRVALKIIKLGMDTKEVVARFEQERQALALMDHPNIARVLEAGATLTGRPYFVMELVRGIKITEYCDQAKLPTPERLRLFMQVCAAVQHAHQKGVIHRDLKPSNILVTLHDGVPVPKVIDFGVAKATQQQRLTDLTVYTHFEQMIGTPLYMAPEQAEMSGLDVDTRSDIYSLGVLLYELLTGQTPFDPAKLMQAGQAEMRRVIREEEPQKPSTLVSTMAFDRRLTVAQSRQLEPTNLASAIKGDLDWIVMKALEKDRNRRYESAGSFARDIERHLGCKPVQAQPPSAGYRLRKFVTRNRGALLAGTGIAAALVLGCIISVWQALRARAGENRANSALTELRASAPAFAEQARVLASQERFDEAIEKLDYAIQLRPDVTDYFIAKGDLLESQGRFRDAISPYRSALNLRPGDPRAALHVELCERLASDGSAQAEGPREKMLELFQAMQREKRSPAEMMRIAKIVGEEKTVLESYWRQRLAHLPVTPQRSLKERLTTCDCGKLKLDFSGTDVSDLSSLKGMPLEWLNLEGCQLVTDLTPLRGLPIKELRAGFMASEDHSGFSGRRAACPISDLSPLSGSPLEALYIEGTKVSDLTPLRGLPLRILVASETRISDLTPLQQLPLTHLECANTAVRDITPLAGLPIRTLNLQFCRITELSPLRNLPLETLLLQGVSATSGYAVLSDLKKLRLLVLPAGYRNFPAPELAAIAALRGHPTLQQIERDSGTTGGLVVGTSSKDDFWKEFDHMETLEAAMLKLTGGERRRMQFGRDTWSLNLQDLDVSDLSSIAGAPIERLLISNTQVSNFEPLRGMPLKALFAAGTPVRDLSPLSGLPLGNLYLDRCPPDLDLEPLSKIRSLKLVLLPRSPRNIESLRNLPNLEFLSDEADRGNSNRLAQTAEQFWRGERPVTAEMAARNGKFAEAESLLRQRLTHSSAVTYWMGLAGVLLARGDRKAFDEVVKEMAQNFRANGSAPTAPVLLCLLTPHSTVNLAELKNWHQGNPDAADPAYWPWHQLIEGLLAFRQAKPKEAIDLLMKVPERPKPVAWADASSVLAMAHHQIGNASAAHGFLERAKKAIHEEWPQTDIRNTDWHDWQLAYWLLREAENLIH